MTAETEVLVSVMMRIEQLQSSSDDAFDLSLPLPRSLEEFETMDKGRRVATKALIKSVEEMEEQLMRLFRTILQLLVVDTTGFYAQDVADHMEGLGIVNDATSWMGIVKLRNRLVHDYPLTSDARFAKLTEAASAIPEMREIADRAFAFIQARGWHDVQ